MAPTGDGLSITQKLDKLHPRVKPYNVFFLERRDGSWLFVSVVGGQNYYYYHYSIFVFFFISSSFIKGKNQKKLKLKC